MIFVFHGYIDPGFLTGVFYWAIHSLNDAALSWLIMISSATGGSITS